MKKKIIYLSVILVLVISLITLSSIYKSKDNKYKKEYNTIPKGMAIMIKEEGATDYTKSTSKDIPKGNYVLNEEKTHCENNGKVTNYNSATGKISLNFIGSDRCYLYFDYKKETIKLGNAELVVNSETPDFSKVATTNEGLFKAQDDLGTSYYFRGAVDNNWVKYGKYTKDMYNCDNGTISATDTGNSCTKIASNGDDIYWRIIRINGDGSIRMIYIGVTPPTESTKVIKTTDTSLGNSPFNKNYDSAEYVGYKYEIGQQHGTGTDSTIKTFVDNWYANYTDLNKTGTKITDQIYCNDRTASTSNAEYSTTNYTTLTSWNSTRTQYYYGAYGRIVKDNNPMLTCAVDSDRFTVNKINSKGNSALTYPIGLITIDEVEMAGGKKGTDNSTYYLYTNQDYWTGSPYSFNSSGISYANEFNVNSSGSLHLNLVHAEYGARPVISLSSETKLTGDGTWNNVFEVEKKGYETILANNTVNETTPDFSKVTTASEKGLYKADDDYTATTGMKSYYFRGAVDNNWVKFGKEGDKDIYWRIIRINGDGSIRMIYSGTTAPIESTKVVMTGTGTQINATTYTFNSIRDKAEYVGYMYTAGEQHGNSTSSGVKTIIENWYAGTTLKDNALVSKDQIYCNDRSASSTQKAAWTSTGATYYYGAYGRLSSKKKPQLTCPEESDKFTSKESSMGNKALEYPVGLITADEIAMAGGGWYTNNTSYYLYTNQYYWLGSPCIFDGTDSSAYEFIVRSSGYLDYNYVLSVRGARPVVSLSSKAKLSGNGTYSKPYTVS